MKLFLKRFLESRGLSLRRTCGLAIGTDLWLQLRFRLQANAKRVDLFFDVGAHGGETAKAIREIFPTQKIICFEPDPGKRFQFNRTGA